MARVKAINRRCQGPPQPRFANVRHQQYTQSNQQPNMSGKRKAADDINNSPKAARSSSPVGGAGGSATGSPAAQLPTGSGAGGSAAATAQLPTASGAGGSAAAASSTQKPVPNTATTTGDPAPKNLFFMQIYIPDVPYNPDGEKEAWMHMDVDHCQVKFDTESGINFIFSEDYFKIIPYGHSEPNIYDQNLCGFTIAPGYCMKWQYDHMFHYHCGNTKTAFKRAFMVVKLQLTKPNPPPYTWKDSPTIDAMIRQRFKTTGPPNLTTPCWFPSSQTERERDYWKGLYQSKKRAYDKAVEDYVEMDDKNILLQNKLEKSEAKVQLQMLALQNIDMALECAFCFQRFSPTEHCMMANCGHVVHVDCKKKLEDKQKANTCIYCQSPIQHWQKFHGFTTISQAFTKLHTAFDKAK